jgi:hypothetical protein
MKVKVMKMFVISTLSAVVLITSWAAAFAHGRVVTGDAVLAKPTTVQSQYTPTAASEQKFAPATRRYRVGRRDGRPLPNTAN